MEMIIGLFVVFILIIGLITFIKTITSILTDPKYLNDLFDNLEIPLKDRSTAKPILIFGVIFAVILLIAQLFT